MRTVSGICIFSFLLRMGMVFADDLGAPIPLPVPPLPEPENRPFPKAVPDAVAPTRPIPQPVRVVQPAPARNSYVGEEPLSWDALTKEYTAKPGELVAPFSFAVTNTSNHDVTINWVRPSCGCTLAKLPPTPWKISPGEGGRIELSVDLRGKYGLLAKYVSVDTSHGQKLLNIRVNIPNNAVDVAHGQVDRRTRNMQIAMADRQAVFKNDCASCHVTPAIGRKGEQLFQAACAICHEAPHRATMVPDLMALPFQPTREYWTHWITHGKPGSLMPAFAQAQGGPLTDEQIQSLADYLTHYYPPRKVVSNSPTPTTED